MDKNQQSEVKDIRGRMRAPRLLTEPRSAKTSVAPKLASKKRYTKRKAPQASLNLKTNIRRRATTILRWWRHNDRKYGVKWRVANLLAVLLIVISVALPVIAEIQNNRGYALSADALQLVGKTDTKLTSKLTYDSQHKIYQFNKDSVKAFSPVDQLRKQVGQPNNKDKGLYALDVQEDMTKGVKYYDINSQLNFSMIPQFKAKVGKMQQGRLIYPITGGVQAVYTLKNNGLKEDIVVNKSTNDTMRFTYTLDLPKTLEARAIPDGSGAIGIYSASPTLFGNITTSTPADEALIKKARENSTKDTLVFGIPAPVITKSAPDAKAKPTARFELRGNQLTVVAESLNGMKRPYSIDPSVVITSTSDFATNGNNDSNIDFPTDQVNRGALTGGEVNRVAADTSCGVANAWCAVQTGTSGYNGSGTGGGGARQNATITYNGFLYSIGGNYDTNSKSINTVSYAAINTSNGSIGSWTVGSTLVGGVGLSNFGGTVYNGYLYVIGGAQQGGVGISTIQYALICTGNNAGQGGCGSTAGSVGTWTASTSSTNFGTASNAPQRVSFAAVAYNGYMYAMGGSGTNPNTFQSDVVYAPILANGDLGSWSPTTSLPNAGSTVAALYNGHIYVGMSCTIGNRILGPGGCTATTSLIIGTISPSGGISSWTTTGTPTYSTLGSLNGNPGFVAANGYLYVIAGNQGGTMYSSVYYAPIYANGSVGAVQTTSTLSNTVGETQAAYSNNYIYLVGGYQGTGTYYSGTQYAKIDTPGTIAAFTSGADFDTAGNERDGMATVASNGYLYILGGDLATGGQTNSVRSAPINADGTLGTWTANTSFTDAHNNATAVAYGGSIYLVGGSRSGTGTVTCTQAQTSYYCQEVIRATINPSNGTLTWSGIYTYSTQGRSNPGAVVVNGYLYVLGGRYQNNSQASDEVDVAPINADGTLGTFTITQHMLEQRSIDANAVAWNGRIYMVGGANSLTTEYAAPASNGTIPASGVGSWAYTAGNLPYGAVGAWYAQVVVYNGYIYVTGGAVSNNNGTTLTLIAKINGDGTITGWTTSSQSFAGNRFAHGSATYNGYLYVLGGCNNSFACNSTFNSVLKDVQYAQINNGGSGVTGAWTSQTNEGNQSQHMGAVAYNGFLYQFGGCTSSAGLGVTTLNTCVVSGGSAMTNSAVYATIASDGTVGTWAGAGNGATFTTARMGLDAFAYNGYLYITGGCSAISQTTAVEYCSAFQNDTQYALFCTGSNAGVGGCSATRGTLGTWSSADTGTPYATARYAHKALAYNGYMYVIGGCSASSSSAPIGACTSFLNDVKYAPINANGTLGTWSSAATGFTAGRMFHSAAISNGYMYVIGGCSAMAGPGDNCTTIKNDVQSIALSTSTGAPTGSWQTVNSFGTARYAFGAMAYNGYLYIVGGCIDADCTNKLATVSYAPLTASGTVGAWNMAADTINTAAGGIAYFGFATYAGNMYTINGVTQVSTYQTVPRMAPIKVIPRVGVYSKLIDFGVRSNVRGISYSGNLPGALGATGGLSQINYNAADTTGAYIASGNAAGGALTNARCTGVNGVRYLFLSATLDDSLQSVFPDGSGANITDITVLYEVSRPPQIRLRLGQTLQQGVLSDLDICKI